MERDRAEPRMSDGRCKMEDVIESSECCKIPKTNREFWVTKIRRNMERDRAEQRKLAEMGWHSIIVWECELKPARREETLNSLEYTLNHIFLLDHSTKRGLRAEGRGRKEYAMPDEGPMMAAEEGEKDPL
jgi:DNA mismatch endonuclease (patch repair protein)